MIIGFIFAALVTIFLSWNQYTHFQDKQKFMTLKKDMLTLQTEFNKIDPGWTYSEWCHAKGEKFKENEVSSCGISLNHKSNMEIMTLQSGLSANTRFGSFGSLKQYSTVRDEPMISMSARHKSSDMKCELYGSVDTVENIDAGDIVYYCQGSALEFYFPKTQ